MSSFRLEDTTKIYNALLRSEAAKEAVEKVHTVCLRGLEQLQHDAVSASATIRRLEQENQNLRVQLDTVQHRQQGGSGPC